MDRNTLTGIVLISIVFFAWMYFTAPSPEELERVQQQRALQDSLNAIEQIDDFDANGRDLNGILRPDTPEPSRGAFATSQAADTTITTVETPYYRILFTSLGGGPAQFELIRHSKFDGDTVTLLADTTRSAYNLGFLSTENYNIDTNELLFIPRHGSDNITIGEGETGSVVYDLVLEDGRTLTFEYLLNGDGYQMSLNIYFDGVRELISGSYYELGWQPRMRTTERSRDQETQYSAAYVYAGGAMESISLTSSGSERETITGNIGWVSTKTKFFTQIIKPEGDTDGAILMADVTGSDNDIRTHYRSILRSIIPADGSSSFNLFVGPLDHVYLDRFDESAYDMVDTGFRFLRWFSDPFVKWVVLPFFVFFGGILPNLSLIHI